MDSLVKTKRDLIELKNGLFKYNLSQSYIPGVALQGNRHDCKFGFFIPPLNEMGFSDKYSQCLIKFNHIHLTGSLITPSANGNFGENGIWFRSDGNAKIGGHGLILVSDIPCRNSYLDASIGYPAGSIELHDPARTQNKLCQYVSGIPKSTPILRTPDVDGVDVQGMKYYLENGTIGLGGTQIADSTAPGNVSAGGVAGMNSVNAYNYENHNDIFTDGVLCGLPFGGIVNFQVMDSVFNVPLCLTSAPGHADGGGTTLELEMVIQLLPNP